MKYAILSIFSVVIYSGAFSQSEELTLRDSITKNEDSTTMDQQEFYSKLNAREFDELLTLSESGVVFDFDLPQYTRQASWGNDYEALFFFWKIGAKEETPFIGQVFERFRNGEGFEVLELEHERKEAEKRKRAVANLTYSDAISPILIGEVRLILEEDSTYSLAVEIEPYIFDDYFVDLQGLSFRGISLKHDLISNGRIEYDVMEFIRFENSIYIYNMHVRPHLLSIAFHKSKNEDTVLTLELMFVLEGDRTGEILKIERVIK